MTDISKIINFSAVLLFLPYFAGTIYLQAYYGYFGIYLSELAFAETIIYVNAFSFLGNFLYFLVLWPGFVFFLAVLLFLFLVPFALGLIGEIRRVFQNVGSSSYVGPILIYAGVLGVLYVCAEFTGRAVADMQFVNKPRAHLLDPSLTKGKLFALENLASDLNEYRHIVSSENTIFLAKHRVQGETFTVLRIPVGSKYVPAIVRSTGFGSGHRP